MRRLALALHQWPPHLTTMHREDQLACYKTLRTSHACERVNPSVQEDPLPPPGIMRLTCDGDDALAAMHRLQQSSRYMLNTRNSGSLICFHSIAILLCRVPLLILVHEAEVKQSYKAISDQNVIYA